jgi:predicted RNA-binding protein associated with RNAse of E/G family
VITESDWSSVWWFFAESGEFRGWYVNLEIPLGRTELGTDRIDGALDVTVDPHRRWQWKDEDEAAAAVEAGRLGAEQLARLRAEGERLIGLAEAGAFPFDGTWCDFRPDPGWPAPALPPGVLDR